MSDSEIEDMAAELHGKGLVKFKAWVTPSQHEILTAVLRDLPNVVKPGCAHAWANTTGGKHCQKCGKVSPGEWD